MSQKEVIINLLNSLVNGQNIQVTEKKLSEYSLSTGYGMLLLSILSNDHGNGNINDLIRHQSGILLKNFLSQNWENNRIDNTEKNSIKQNILNKSLFEDKNSKIRKTTGMIISVLAEFDYPEKWNNLLNCILSYIHESFNNKNILLLSGSIDTLTYFIQHICDLQIPSIGPVLFPLLFDICKENEINTNIRYNTLSVYHSLLNVTLEMRIINKDLTKELINPTIIKYLKFINDDILLSNNINFIKLQILSLKILNDITKSYSLSIVNCLPMILRSTWKLMIYYSDIDIKHDYESDDNIYQFYDNAFIWIFSILRHRRREIGNLLDDKLNDISFLIIKLLNLSADDIDLFINAPNEFILNEENIYYQNNLRSLIRNVIVTILEIRPRTAYCSLLQSAKKALNSTDPDICTSIEKRESILLVFGYLAQYSSSSSTSLKIEDFLQKILWKDLHNKSQSLLQYRALWTLNKFLYSLNSSAKKQILPQIYQCMKSTNTLSIRYISFKCFETMILCNNGNGNNITSIDRNIIILLCELLNEMDASTLKYLLSSLCIIIKYNQDNGCKYEYEYESQIIPLIINLWSKYCLNQDTTHYIKKVISIYAKININNVIKHVIPTLKNIFSSPSADVCVDVINTALHILHILMINSFKHKNNNNNNNNNEINMIFYKEFLPKILDLVYSTRDCAQMNICAKLLCLLINNNPQFIINGKLTQQICQIISKYLSSEIPENASIGIGSLINQLIINLKCTLNDSMFTNLLLTIINRINTCSTATLRNELLLIFPKLIHEYDEKQIIQFLYKNQKLNYILTLWLNNHNDFIYPYYKKISITALAKILNNNNNNNNIINNMSFNGYPIININAPRATRSKSHLHQLQFTKMPFVVKFFQLLINTFKDLVGDCHECDEDGDADDEDDDDEDEYEYEYEEEYEDDDEDDDEYNPNEEADTSTSNNDNSSSDEDCEEDEDDDYIKTLQQGNNVISLLRNGKNKMIDSQSNYRSSVVSKEIELELCPEAANDTIFYMDFETWCKEFTKKISNQNGKAFQHVISLLNDEDKKILRKILE